MKVADEKKKKEPHLFGDKAGENGQWPFLKDQIWIGIWRISWKLPGEEGQVL